MLYLLPAWILSLALAFLFGYHYRSLVIKLKQLEQLLQSKADKQEAVVEEPKSEFLDPDDLVQQAKWERDELMKKLNR